PAARGLDHVRVAVVEHVHQIDPLRFALHAPGIEVITRRPLLRTVKRARQNDPRGIDRLGPPAHERLAPVAALLRGRSSTSYRVPGQRANVSGQPDIESEVSRFQPVVQTMRVLIHRRPSLERKVWYQKDG